MELEARLTELLRTHPAERSVRLVGSRAESRATELSDYDLLVETDEFERVREDLPGLLEPLSPLAAQWDRLSKEASYYMLMLPGGLKVDLIFERPPEVEPPWEVRAETLEGIDRHFWDWILWLGSKALRGERELVDGHLGGLMFEHLLRPLGVAERPQTIVEAIAGYREALADRERDLGVDISTSLGEAVLARLRSAGIL